jgi:general secretion pathway protein L
MMAEQIIARFLSHKDMLLQWLVLDHSNTGEIQQGTLQDLAQTAGENLVTLLYPAAEVLLLDIDLPVKSNKQIKKALPFALEELLADEMETYHLVWHRQVTGKVYVAAINQEKFKTCLTDFKEQGINLGSVFPESLCLPYQADSYSLFMDHQNAILRTGQWQGGGIDTDALPIVLNKILRDNPDLHTLECWSVGEPAMWLSGLSVNLSYHETDPGLLLLNADIKKKGGQLNLLTGEFERKNSRTVEWKRWLPALCIIFITFFLQIGFLLNSYWQKKTELATIEAHTTSLFKQTFPEVKRLVNIKVQAEQQLVDLKKQSKKKGGKFMQLLYQTGEVITANPGLEIRQLDYINEMLQVQLNATDISQVEQVKQQLEGSNELLIKVQSAEANPKGVEVHYEITQK